MFCEVGGLIHVRVQRNVAGLDIDKEWKWKDYFTCLTNSYLLPPSSSSHLNKLFQGGLFSKKPLPDMFMSHEHRKLMLVLSKSSLIRGN